MSDILRKWLTHSLGIVLDLSSDKFGLNARDGRLIAHILHNYDIISSVQLSVIVPTDDPLEARQNFNHIKIWLNNINIHCDDTLYDDIADGKSSAAIQLFYQLYLIFESPENLYVIQNKKLQRFIPSQNTRFQVHKVKDELKECISNNPLAKPLKDQQELIQWYKTKYQNIEKKIKETREHYKKYVENKCKHKKPHPTRFFDVKPTSVADHGVDLLDADKKKMYHEFCQTIRKFDLNEMRDCTYDELLSIIHAEQSMENNSPVPEDIMHKVKQKFRQITTARKYKQKLESKLIQDLWNDILSKQEDEFDKLIAEKTLKQSEYEKQIVTKCFDVRNQKNIIAENRRLVENLIERRRADDFNNAVLYRVEELQTVQRHYDFERERNIQLHRKLYAKRLKSKADMHYNICNDIINTFVDMAVKTADYERLHNESVPQFLLDQWRQLFLASQPLYDYLEHVEKVINEIPGPVEKIVQMEYDRQNILNDNDLFEYTHYLGQWQLRILFEDNLKEIDESVLNESYVLIGHIVHRLLLTKYPIPSNLSPPKIPNFRIAAAVTNITDYTLMGVLRDLLKRANVTIIQIESAIKYVLECFQMEMLGIEDIEIKFYDETVRWILSSTNVSLVVVPDSKNKKISEKAKKKQAQVVKKKPQQLVKVKPSKQQVVIYEKSTQTPKILPVTLAKENFTEEALLGKQAYESLVLGKPINDHLMAEIIIAYLKTLEDYRGYVLLNYPRTLKQALILEHRMTAKIPKINEDLLSSMTTIDDLLPSIENLLINKTDSQIQEDPHKLKRISKIVPNPNCEIKTYNDPKHTTFFTAFITARRERKADYENRKPTEMYDEGTPLDKFYTNEGVQYILYYEKLDFETIVYLAKLIIGDYSMPLKTSIDLFGSIYEELQQIYNKKGKKKSGTLDPASAVKKLPFHSKSTSEVISSEMSVTTGDGSQQATDDQQKDAEDKKFSHALINPNIGVGIATLWENMENVYLNDIKELFFIKRANRESIMPYCTFVKDHMKQFIVRPDNKQSTLQEFQYYYNAINNDLRDDGNIQAELHCRVDELRNKLWEMCDERLQEVENERQRLIKCHWVTDQMLLLTNLFINLMQIELNRTADTLQVIQDYYMLITSGKLDMDELIQKIKLQKVETVERKLGSMESVPPSYSYDREKIVFTPIGQQIYDTMVQLFINISTSSFADTPFMEYIKNNSQLAIQHIENWKSKLIDPPQTGSDISLKTSKRQINEEEWQEALNIELKRIRQRIKAIQQRAYIDIKELFDCSALTFYTIYSNIQKQYNNEIKSVKTVCEVFDKAIMDQIKIQYELVLDNKDFLVYSDTLLYPSKPLKSKPAITEQLREGEFTYKQLKQLFDIFFDVAPNGSIPERVLTFILQDLIFSDAEDGFHDSVPLLWRHVDPTKVSSILYDMFGDPEFVDWRDFLIYNMGLRFPTENEVLKTWMTYRLYDTQRKEIISRKHFKYVRLWFETEPQVVEHSSIIINPSTKTSHASTKVSELVHDVAEVNKVTETTTKVSPKEMRISLLKELLFDMFQVDVDCLNYTGLLLAFCKDEKPIMGLVKALSLTLESLIGWDPKLGAEREKQDILECYNLEVVDGEQMGEMGNDSNLSKYNCFCGDTTIVDYSSPDRLSQYTNSSSNMLSNDNDDSVPSILPYYYQQKHLSQTKNDDFDEEQQYFQKRSFVSIALAHTYSDNQLSIYNNRVYLLPIEAPLVTLAACLPWHIRVECIANQSLRQLLEKIHADLFETHAHPSIYAYKFLQHPIILDMLSTCFKFQALYPPDIVRKHVRPSNQF